MYTSLTNGEDVERRATLMHLALNLAHQSEAISHSEGPSPEAFYLPPS